MLNRKATKAPRGIKKQPRGRERTAPKARPVRRRFIISSKSTHKVSPRPDETKNGHNKPKLSSQQKTSPQQKISQPKMPIQPEPNATATLTTTVDLTETIKTLLHLSQENGYVTYDDI